MISKQHYQLRGIDEGGAQHRLPCDFPVKSGSGIYFIDVGICLLMCSRNYAVFWILVIFVSENTILG